MTLPIVSSILTTLIFGSIAVVLSLREERLVERLLDQDRKNKQRLYEITILKQIQERIGYSLDVEKIVEVIISSLKDFIPYSTASSLLIVSDKCIFKNYSEESVSHEYIKAVKESMLTSLKSMTDPVPSTLEEITVGLVCDDRNTKKMASFFHIPIIHDDEVIGIINISSTVPNLYKEEEMSLLYQITNQASNALAKLQIVLNTEKGKLMAMISSLVDGVFMIDTEKNVLVINKAALSFLNLKKPHPTIVEILSIVPKPDEFMANIEKALAENKTIEQKNLTFGEKIFDIFITPVITQQHITPLGKDQTALKPSVIGASVLLHDITLEKSMQQMKEDFTNIMVHELRSPLTAIRASSQLIKLQDSKLTPEERVKLLDLINTQAKKLLDEVAMILDAAKLENGMLKIEKTMGDLKKVIDEQVEVFKASSLDKHITLLTHVDEAIPETAFDSRYIAEVLNNLLSNSLKFTPVGGKIMVSAIQSGKKIKIAVSDNGPGIPKEKQDLLFHKFSQVSRANAQVGTGLGLYITKGIIEAHGGEITLESELDRGTTIAFTLPISTEITKDESVLPLTHQPAVVN